MLGLWLACISVSRIAYPFDTGTLEAFSWIPAQHLLAGTNPYAYATVPPYSMAPYGILYYGVIALGIKLFGLQLWFGRTASIIALALCIWAVARIVKNAGGGAQAQWVASLCCIVAPAIQDWAGIMRSDLLGSALSIWAVAAATPLADEPAGSRSHLRVALAAGLNAGAFFTKPTLILSIFIILIHLAQSRRWADLSIYIIFLGLFLGPTIFLVDLTSNGGYLWQHYVHASRVPFSVEQVWRVVWAVTQSAATPLLAAAAGLFLLQQAKIPLQQRDDVASGRPVKRLIFLYLLLSLTSATISVGRTGSGTNYYLEFFFVAAIASGLVLQDLLRGRFQNYAQAFVVIVILAGAFQSVRTARGEYFRWQAAPYFREVSETASRSISPGAKCISRYAELVMRSGCELYFDDHQEYYEGWSPKLGEIFREKLASGDVALIIWNTDMLDKQFPNYEGIPINSPAPARFPPVFLYRPRR
ncbi:MAG: glycosyltransferase family 39 protein [Acidobacteria bacterium]|nr:glycosyltransferase family 39 protein [Acidobacteriota bacterium]